MSDLQKDFESFKISYEKFVIACDATEEQGLWPVDRLGEMEAWFTNDISCLITALTAADGVFHAEEAAYLNDALEFNYSPEDLKALYDELGPELETYLERAIPESVKILEGINEKLAEEYGNMLRTVADFIIESDGVTAEAEIKAAERLLAALEQ